MSEAKAGKIERKYLAHFIDSSFGDTTENYVRLGKDLEELNTEFNADIETKKNILGELSIVLSGYEASDTVEPYYIEKTDPLSTAIQDIVDNRKVLDDVKTKVVDVYIWKGENTNACEAYREEAYIEITSFGGDTSGVQTAFTVHRTGSRVKGTFDLTTKTFTVASA